MHQQASFAAGCANEHETAVHIVEGEASELGFAPVALGADKGPAPLL